MHPFAQLGELVAYVNSTYEVRTTRSTISRALKRANLDRGAVDRSFLFMLMVASGDGEGAADVGSCDA
jgi:hypothetical protein